MKERFFKLAEKLSKFGEHHQHRIGAVIVYKNRPIGLGFNKMKTSPRSNHKYNMLHAEVTAVLNANPEYLKGASIYVFRKTRNNTLGTARPCESCSALLKHVGIKKIYFSSETGYKEECYE